MPDSHARQVAGSLVVATLLGLGAIGVASARVDVVAVCTGGDSGDEVGPGEGQDHSGPGSGGG